MRTLLHGFLLAALLSVVSCDTSEEAYVSAECPSPDGSMKAVSWYAMGGGAAGWTEQDVSVIPRDWPASAVLKKRTITDGHILRLAHTQRLRLTWLENQTLLVEYPDTAWIHAASPGGAYSPLTPKLKVLYRGVAAVSGATSDHETVCGAATAYQ